MYYFVYMGVYKKMNGYIEYIKQDDDRCLAPIREVGCFFRSSLHCVELAKGRIFTPNQINELWELAKEKHILDDYNNLRDSAQLMNLALDYLDENNQSRFAEIGIKRGNNIELYAWARKHNIVPNYYIRKIKQGGKSKYHFIVVDKDKNLVFDPYSTGIRELGEVYTICYRYYGV